MMTTYTVYSTGSMSAPSDTHESLADACTAAVMRTRYVGDKARVYEDDRPASYPAYSVSVHGCTDCGRAMTMEQVGSGPVRGLGCALTFDSAGYLLCETCEHERDPLASMALVPEEAVSA